MKKMLGFLMIFSLFFLVGCNGNFETGNVTRNFLSEYEQSIIDLSVYTPITHGETDGYYLLSNSEDIEELNELLSVEIVASDDQQYVAVLLSTDNSVKEVNLYQFANRYLIAYLPNKDLEATVKLYVFPVPYTSAVSTVSSGEIVSNVIETIDVLEKK